MKLYIATYISRAGHASRRNAIELVKSGRVLVNNVVVTDPVTKVDEHDIVVIDGKKITAQNFIYILLNKPTGCITTTSDEKGRKTVLDYVKTDEKIFPVGRLDQDTTGLLLLTNDGDLAQQLMHPRFEIEKEYQVALDKPLTKSDFEKLQKGIALSDGFLKPDALTFVQKNDCTKVSIIIHSGKKRVIRRFFGHIGYEVIALDRVRYAIFTKNNLKIGSYLYINEDELQQLREYIKRQK